MTHATGSVRARQDQVLQRRQMLDCIRAQKGKITELVELFCHQGQRSDNHCLLLIEQVIVIIDHIVSSGDWEASLFLRNTIKPLKELREQFIHLEQQLGKTTAANQAEMGIVVPEGMKVVYVSLFQSDGHNLAKWSLQLQSLTHYVLGRPIYEQEEDVRKMIRSKIIQTSEAYAAVAIVPESVLDISQQAGERFDRLGSSVLVLSEGAIKTEQILEFVHQNKHYAFVSGKLVEKEKK